MNDRYALVLAVASSVAAAIVVSLLLRPSAATMQPSTASDWDARFERLQVRLQSLEDRPLRPETVEQPVGVPQRVLVADADNVERLAAIEARLAELERWMRQLASGERAPPRQPVPDPDPGPVVTSDIQARAWIVDPLASVEQKMKAHEALRRVRDAYTPEMVQQLLNIGQFNPDGQVRADVWRFFDGDSHLPVLVSPLLKALTSDPEGRAREEVVETLGNYAGDDRAIVSALQHAAQFDEDPRVRAKAKRTLAQIQRSR